MRKFSYYYGIDVSKDVLDLMDQNDLHFQVENNLKGFKEILKKLGKDACVVMEATGVYHTQLADYLHNHGVFVSVVNPLVIKRFIQMNLRRIKTDKADAQMICKYAQYNVLRAYLPPSFYVKESRIIVENIDLLIKSRTMLKNRLHAIKHRASKHRFIIINPIKKSIKELTVQIDKLEQELMRLIKANHPDLYSCLQSIPGI